MVEVAAKMMYIWEHRLDCREDCPLEACYDALHHLKTYEVEYLLENRNVIRSPSPCHKTESQWNLFRLTRLIL